MFIHEIAEQRLNVSLSPKETSIIARVLNQYLDYAASNRQDEYGKIESMVDLFTVGAYAVGLASNIGPQKLDKVMQDIKLDMEE